MRLKAELFGGIEFVRVCSLSESQKKLFLQSPVAKKMIIVLRGKELLPDCLLYQDYDNWYFELALARQRKSFYSAHMAFTSHWLLFFSSRFIRRIVPKIINALFKI